ncbi:MAG: tetratricopeptide repeat protein [Gemmatimonadota bacterium]|nr:tetratricopeptide repeat protein [Gemmatimonadota bacterium]
MTDSPPSPTGAAALLARAHALTVEGQMTDALALVRQALRDDPMSVDSWSDAGMTALRAGDAVLAAGLLGSYVRMHPRDAKALARLGFATFALGDYDTAADAARRACALRADKVGWFVFLGQVARMAGAREESDASFAAALALEPTSPKARVDAAMTRVLLGDNERGWREFEEHHRSAMNPRLLSPWQRSTDTIWLGDSQPGRTLVLHHDGGLGDTIVFARFIPEAASRVERVLLNVQPRLSRLLSVVPGVSGFVNDDEQYADDSWLHCSLWSLPALVGARPEQLASLVPYLHAPDDGPVLAPRRAKTRVGIAWAGRASYPMDRDRSVPSLDVLAPLFAVPGVEWQSLQVGEREEEADRFGIPRCRPERDLADTAAIIAQLDLVITIDSAIANLAGALGARTWLFAETFPEWRWQLDRAESPWYPTVRIFRRRHSREWAAVAAEMTGALRTLVAARAAE